MANGQLAAFNLNWNDLLCVSKLLKNSGQVSLNSEENRTFSS
jgi:hypothetical protein